MRSAGRNKQESFTSFHRQATNAKKLAHQQVGALNRLYTSQFKKSLLSYWRSNNGEQAFGTNNTKKNMFVLPDDKIHQEVIWPRQSQDQNMPRTKMRMSVSLYPLGLSIDQNTKLSFIDFESTDDIKFHDQKPVCAELLQKNKKTISEKIPDNESAWKQYTTDCMDVIQYLHYNTISDNWESARSTQEFYQRDFVATGAAIVCSHRARYNVKCIPKNNTFFFDNNKITAINASVDILSTSYVTETAEYEQQLLYERLENNKPSIFVNQEVTVSIDYEFEDLQIKYPVTSKVALKVLFADISMQTDVQKTNAASVVFGPRTIIKSCVHNANGVFQTFSKNSASEWIATNLYTCYMDNLAKSIKNTYLVRLCQKSFVKNAENNWDMLPCAVYTPITAFMVFGYEKSHAFSMDKSHSLSITTFFGTLAETFEPTNMYIPERPERQRFANIVQQRSLLTYTPDEKEEENHFLQDDLDIGEVLRLASLPSLFDNSLYM